MGIKLGNGGGLMGSNQRTWNTISALPTELTASILGIEMIFNAKIHTRTQF